LLLEQKAMIAGEELRALKRLDEQRCAARVSYQRALTALLEERDAFKQR
jgi:hypothetical protein